MTLEEINELTLDGVFEIILNRIVNFFIIPSGDEKYTFLTNYPSKYENLVIHPWLVKPPLETMGIEFEKYRNELREVILLEQRAALRLRWEAIPNLRECNTYRGIDFPNPAIYININLEDESLLTTIEDLSPTLLAIVNAEKALQDKAELGKKIRAFCDLILNTVAGDNEQSGLTANQVDDMQGILEPIEAWLRRDRPRKAKELIQAITSPDLVPMRDVVLSLYFKHGF